MKRAVGNTNKTLPECQTIKSINFESTQSKSTEHITQVVYPICQEKYVCGYGGKPIADWI